MDIGDQWGESKVLIATLEYRSGNNTHLAGESKEKKG
jgi:hypothetical protein